MNEVEFIESVSVLEVRDGDTVAVKINDLISMEIRDKIHEAVKKQLPEVVKILILDGSADIGVIRKV